MYKHLRLSRWFRVLLWALAGSMVLHWVLLDFLRGSVSLSLQGGPALQVKLPDQADGAASQDVASPAPVVSENVRKLPAPDAAPQRRAKAPNLPRDAQPETGEQALAAPVGLVGLRSGSREEGLVAMRIAVAQGLSASGLSLPGPLVVWCDFNAAGQLLAVRSDGVVPKQLLLRLQRLAGSLVVPAVLQGQGFSLDLVFDRSERQNEDVGAGGSKSMVRN